MLHFLSNLSPDIDALAVFVNEKYKYKDKKGVLPNSIAQKLNSYLAFIKKQKKEEDINSFDISDKKKCFIIRIKNKYDSYAPQEKGGSFFSHLKQYKEINKIDLYPDSLEFENKKLISFYSQFIF